MMYCNTSHYFRMRKFENIKYKKENLVLWRYTWNKAEKKKVDQKSDFEAKLNGGDTDFCWTVSPAAKLEKDRLRNLNYKLIELL